MTAIRLGGFLRGRFISFVHIGRPSIPDGVYAERPRAAISHTASTIPLRTAYIRS